MGVTGRPANISGAIPSLKLTANAPENISLEDEIFFSGPSLFSGVFAVSFRECIYTYKIEKEKIPQDLQLYEQLLLLFRMSSSR